MRNSAEGSKRVSWEVDMALPMISSTADFYNITGSCNPYHGQHETTREDRKSLSSVSRFGRHE